MISLSEWRLYVIVDRAAIGSRDLVEMASAAIRGGADVIQLRDKTASTRQLLDEAQELLCLTQHAGVALIINDRVDVASTVGAGGVHLGQEDLPVEAARKMLGAGRLIGKSTHSLEQALVAQAEGADYIGFGPIFPTPTKPEYGSIGSALIRQVAQQVRLPIICIGGIDERTLPQVMQRGAERIAVVRAVCGAKDPEAAARELKTTLTQFSRSSVPSRL